MKLEQEKKLAIANVIQSLAENIPFINAMEKYVHINSKGVTVTEVLAVQYTEDRHRKISKKYARKTSAVHDITFPNIPGAVFTWSASLYLRLSNGNHEALKPGDYIVFQNDKFGTIRKLDFESIYTLKY